MVAIAKETLKEGEYDISTLESNEKIILVLIVTIC